MQQGIFIVPFLVILHLLFSIWMYSDESVFFSDSLVDTSVFGFDTGISTTSIRESVDAGFLGEFELGRRLLRINVIPLLVVAFVITALSITFWLLNSILGNLILRPLKSICMRFCCCCLVRHFACCQSVRREFNPPLTEHFLKVIRDPKSRKGAPILDPKKAAATLTTNERSRGWQVRHDKKGEGHDGSGLYYKCRVWQNAGISHGRHHDVGQLYYTYETMDESGIPSYSIADNPEYKVAISAQLAAANSARAIKKALGKVKLGARLKGNSLMNALGGAMDAKKKEHMVHKYAVAKSYAETSGPRPD